MYASELAREEAGKHFGNKVFVRGLIEFSNHCKNDCFYCGIRNGNRNADRYRLDREEILAACREGHRLGFRTFVLQGGEDAHFTDSVLVDWVTSVKTAYPDCALTLSLGERTQESYRLLFAAGADRYLLRHETADAAHYSALHPAELTLAARLRCLRDLRETGFQTGCGFMVGTPGQTAETLAEDILFLAEFRPEMAGIGPFIPHADTPFAGEKAGGVELTLFLLSLARLVLPDVLLPATTALGSLAPDGRERGILAGANVVMPNLSPVGVRDKYSLYNNKLSSAAEAAENLADLRKRLENLGRRGVEGRGDAPAAIRRRTRGKAPR
jgi:biotin synthase